jgi:hypothetical protein
MEFEMSVASKKKIADEAAEDSNYEFKPAGESDDEDEKVQMELLRKERVKEELEKSQAESKRLAAIEEKLRKEREEILYQRRILNNNNRKAQRAEARCQKLCCHARDPRQSLHPLGHQQGRLHYPRRIPSRTERSGQPRCPIQELRQKRRRETQSRGVRRAGWKVGIIRKKA